MPAQMSLSSLTIKTNALIAVYRIHTCTLHSDGITALLLSFCFIGFKKKKNTPKAQSFYLAHKSVGQLSDDSDLGQQGSRLLGLPMSPWSAGSQTV